MKKLLISASFAALFASPVFAAPVTYTVDSSHTFPRFSYNHMGMSKQISRFDKTTGTVTLDSDAGTASVDITIDMTSVSTGFAPFNQHIQGADFFDTATHPTATFKSTNVEFKDGKPVSIDGDLTIKGITKPITLEVTSFLQQPHPMLKKDAIGANAQAQIKRSDFGAGKLAPAIGDEISLDIALEAIAQ